MWLALPRVVWVQVVVIALVCVAGAWSGTVAERHFDRRDPGQVVVDEVAGMMVTLLLNPVAGPAGMPSRFCCFAPPTSSSRFP